jgi:hypothetical protein
MGATLVSLLEAMPGTWLAAQIGACLLGFVGGLMGANGEREMRRKAGRSPNVVGGAFFGLVAGAFVGATVGAVVMVGLGALAGAVAGLLLCGLLALFGIRWPGALRLTLACTLAGSVVLAYRADPGQALNGLWHGALAGIGVALLVVFGGTAYFKRIMPGPAGPAQPEEDDEPSGSNSAP